VEDIKFVNAILCRILVCICTSLAARALYIQ